jgi:hypothetical protein
LDNINNLEEQLMLLKMMTMKTGVIHEAQALQLKVWPKLIPGVLSSVAKVSAENKTVIFELKGNIKNTKKTKQMFSAIKEWTRLILWDNTKIVFKYDKKAIYSSEGKNV